MIGLFDSGLGGLTILRQLEQDIPHYDYLYLGDTARAPYGSKNPEEIIKFTWQGVEHLFQRGAKLVLLACNTASAVALRHIQQEKLSQYPNHNVLGIVVPTIEQITGANWKHQQPITTPLNHGGITVGVLATESTVNSGTYSREIHKRNPSIKVIEQACPRLVPLIEQQSSLEELNAAIQEYLTLLQSKANPRLYAVLLGCTHYELVAEQIKTFLPSETRLYQQPKVVAKSLENYLKNHPQAATSQSKRNNTKILLTGHEDLPNFIKPNPAWQVSNVDF
jgi:glutamate racemase